MGAIEPIHVLGHAFLLIHLWRFYQGPLARLVGKVRLGAVERVDGRHCLVSIGAVLCHFQRRGFGKPTSLSVSLPCFYFHLSPTVN